MANKGLFKSFRGSQVPPSDAHNAAGGVAYAFTPAQALAQYAATGCLNDVFYADARTQLGEVLDLCNRVLPETIAKTAIYCRQRGHMKDLPAILCAALSRRDPALLTQVFPRVIDDAKMLRTFVQVMRSGSTGRKSLGSRPKKLVQGWLDARSDEAIFRAAVGQDPSLADVIKMVHPTPATPSRRALYGYLLGRSYDAALLPELVRAFEGFKQNHKLNNTRGDEALEVPDVPFQMLTSLDLGQREWTAIACKAGWQMTRMNLNTFARHGVFKVGQMTEVIAQRLRDPQAIAKAKVFPYQLLAAALNTTDDVPRPVREALHDAMELATANVPAIAGKVFVLPDVSGSMSSPLTGFRSGATTAMRCIDVAALIAASLLRKNPDAEVLPFDTEVRSVRVEPRDTVMTNAQRLAAVGGGGTSCSAPLALLNQRKAQGDLVIYVSDNASWADVSRGPGTATLQQWSAFRQRNPRARLVCIDLQPYANGQAAERVDVLNVGGFSDAVFEVIAAFAHGGLSTEHWAGEIERVPLEVN